MEQGTSVRVAAVQAASVAFDLKASVEKLQHLVVEAKQGGAQLVLFPEAFLGGYPRHLDFRIGARTAENREWYSRYVSIPADAQDKDWLADDNNSVVDEYWAFVQLCHIARKNAVVGAHLDELG
ncbi:hypothetical protein IAR55_000347 [Kwoniella newhampshirensis]|uniref:CN hydrolase domain-containing protein n=1 Tax=Kwoniella newhampshirensis TaxID=1651941 RepID=A0AAW0Z6J7_9TREE